MNWNIFKILAAIASTLADGKITKEEAKAIVSLIIDAFLIEELNKNK